MRFTVTGSGGCVSIPRPLCFCEVCEQAREKGPPYSRCGCSLYLHDAALLVDTPEDIVHALNQQRISSVERILYSHWDPDHTLGMRVVEQMNLDWLAFSEGVKCQAPVTVYSLPNVLRDVNAISNKFGSFFDYYQHMGVVLREATKGPLLFGNITITFTPVDKEATVTVFTFEQAGRRLVYAPCDVKPFPQNEAIDGADVLIIGNTMVGETLKAGFCPKPDSPFLQELFTLEEVVDLRRKRGFGRVVITHLEEDWGKSHDDYMQLAKSLDGVSFAYDGLVIEI